jgi:hypothetical protein
MVEIPRMDGDLHLLALMHQQLEEAQGLRKREPRLEFQVDASGLTIRVAGADHVEEVRYDGLYHQDALVEEAGERLRRLSGEGYVELGYDGTQARTGTVTITEAGLEKLRYRRVFESNLPRSSKRWEFSLLGHREVRHMRLWRASWEGREITVRNRLILLGERNERVTEHLNVDHRFPPGYRAERSRFAKDLYGDLRARDGVHELRAHIGLTAPWLKTGCLISVDGMVIGGDVGVRFLT